MLDFKQLYCTQHNHETIINFCNKDECQVPLCPNCVCEHTQWHIERGTHPCFENIRDTYSRIQADIRAGLKNHEDLRSRINAVELTRKTKRTQIESKLSLAKQQCIEAINEAFEAKRVSIARAIDHEERQEGFQNKRRLQALDAKTSYQITELLSLSQELSTVSFLETMRRTRNCLKTQNEKVVPQMNEEITRHENFQIILNEKNVLADLKTLVAETINVSFSRPNDMELSLLDTVEIVSEASFRREIENYSQSRRMIEEPQICQMLKENRPQMARSASVNSLGREMGSPKPFMATPMTQSIMFPRQSFTPIQSNNYTVPRYSQEQQKISQYMPMQVNSTAPSGFFTGQPMMAQSQISSLPRKTGIALARENNFKGRTYASMLA